MKQSLFNIENDYLTLIDQIEEADGEVTPEQLEELEINQGQLQSKSIAYLSVIKDKEAFNDQIKEEILRLNKIMKTNNNSIDRLKNSLLQAVETFGDFATEFQKFSIRKSVKVEVENVNELPEEFKTIKTTETADKAAIKKAIKSGQEVKGAELIESNNLKIN